MKPRRLLSDTSFSITSGWLGIGGNMVKTAD
jgi:hypothetical protein